MNILLIGGGGREHAIAKKINESKKLKNFYSIPGNPGISSISKVIGNSLDVNDIVSKAIEYSIDIIVCGPEQPLVEGLSDLAEKEGIKVFGPKKSGAMLEGSKIFSKQFMSKYDIPTSDYKVFNDYYEAEKYFNKRTTYPVVIKADGLAAGKGVKIAKNREEAHSVIKSYMIDRIFGTAGECIVVEEFMTGEEMSALYITDGKTFIPLLAAKDYKRAYDNDSGENTGGMGSYAPHNSLTSQLADKINEQIINNVRIGFNKENIEYNGVLYVGLMLTEDGPKVVEFNCRFGDPETQAILPLLETDILDMMYRCVKNNLNNFQLKWKNLYSCCVVIASGGYPDDYKKNIKIKFNGNPFDFIHAGTKYDNDNNIVTNGGRVLNAVALGSSKTGAIQNAYKLIEKVEFEDYFYRKDIGS